MGASAAAFVVAAPADYSLAAGHASTGLAAAVVGQRPPAAALAALGAAPRSAGGQAAFAAPVGAALAATSLLIALRSAVRRRDRRSHTRSARTQAAAQATQVAPASALAEEWVESQVRKASAASGGRLDAALSERGLVTLRELGAPARNQEPWKYSDLKALFDDSALAPLPAPSEDILREAVAALLEETEEGQDHARLVFVDGVLSPEFSRPGRSDKALVGGALALAVTGGAEVKARIAELLGPLPEKDMFLANKNDALGCAKLAALNQSLLEDCACVLADDAEAPDSEAITVEVAFITTGSSPSCACPRVLVQAGKNRRLRVIESHLSSDPSDVSLSNGVCRIIAAEGAVVEHDLLQQKADGSRFVESLTAEVAAGASYQLRLLQTGARAGRVNAAMALQGEGASCKVLGTLLADEEQQLDLHSLIHHSVPGGKSEQLHKNIVAGSAECIFKGSIRVDKAAQQTTSSQLCRTLLLTKKAKVKAMPSLQIQADDVTCSHGAAITELDETEVFYMRSRGLDPGAAKKLLLVAFPQDLLGDLSKVAPKVYQRAIDKLVRMAAQ
mmetsp:Transcript_119370/g.380682  ORF Transcript_119370/g.380682 Transcript_119370/m.380682 type:complete len:561 (+) Transcript_119370:69-1751(+)